MDKWNPTQYEKFKGERQRQILDLINLVRKKENMNIIDLGCGTGEFTKQLHLHFHAKETLGIDSSLNMLQESQKYLAPGLQFEHADIKDFKAKNQFDLVFSNAALQWLPNHKELIPNVLKLVADNGQVAIQVPSNYDHPSHQVAEEIAHKLFPEIHSQHSRAPFILKLEEYADILFQNGFSTQECITKIYGNPMKSGRDVVEWTKGTFLTNYQKVLSENDFNFYVKEYEKELIKKIGDGPYFFTFKRMLLWGQKQ